MMKIELTYTAYQKMMAYINAVPGEISGLGRSCLSEDKKKIIVSDFWIWKQTCSSTTTEVVDHDSVFSLAADLVAQGIPMNELNLWWHSHANMGVFFSSTDQQTIDEWVNDRFLVAIVGNKKGELHAVVSVKEPIPVELEAEVLIQYPRADEAMLEQVVADVAENVKIKTYTSTKTQSYSTETGRLNYEVKEAEWAETCSCDECIDYLYGKRKWFSYSTHEKVGDSWFRKQDSEQEKFDNELSTVPFL